MNSNQKTKEKLCTFFTSDYHFEMISLPYIDKNIEENKKVFILTENNLENTVNKLISNINLKEEKKNKILNLDWNNDNNNKLEEINKNIKNKEDVIIFIKGKEKYIENINKNLEKYLTKDNKIKIIDCYDFTEISDKIDKVVKNYYGILNTIGEKNIK